MDKLYDFRYHLIKALLEAGPMNNGDFNDYLADCTPLVPGKSAMKDANYQLEKKVRELPDKDRETLLGTEPESKGPYVIKMGKNYTYSLVDEEAANQIIEDPPEWMVLFDPFNFIRQQYLSVLKHAQLPDKQGYRLNGEQVVPQSLLDLCLDVIEHSGCVLSNAKYLPQNDKFAVHGQLHSLVNYGQQIFMLDNFRLSQKHESIRDYDPIEKIQCFGIGFGTFDIKLIDLSSDEMITVNKTAYMFSDNI